MLTFQFGIIFEEGHSKILYRASTSRYTLYLDLQIIRVNALDLLHVGHVSTGTLRSCPTCFYPGLGSVEADDERGNFIANANGWQLRDASVAICIGVDRAGASCANSERRNFRHSSACIPTVRLSLNQPTGILISHLSRISC